MFVYYLVGTDWKHDSPVQIQIVSRQLTAHRWSLCWWLFQTCQPPWRELTSKVCADRQGRVGNCQTRCTVILFHLFVVWHFDSSGLSRLRADEGEGQPVGCHQCCHKKYVISSYHKLNYTMLFEINFSANWHESHLSEDQSDINNNIQYFWHYSQAPF